MPSGPACRRSVLTVVAAGLAVAAGTAVLLFRQTGVGALDTLYAEDGTIFLGEAARRTFPGSLFTPYMGYLHLVPRLVAEGAAAAGPERAATFFAIGAAAIVSSLALVVYCATAGHIRSVPLRALLAASVVLLPLGQEEVFNNVANIHWFLIFTSAWVLLWDPESTAGQAVGALVLVLGGLSDPLMAVLLPIALLRAWSRRDRRGRLLPAAYGIGLLGQLAGMAITGAERQGLEPTFDAARVAGWYAYNVMGRAVVGTAGAPGPSSLFGWMAAAVVAVSAAAAIAALLKRRAALPLAAAVLAGTSGVFFLATVVPTGNVTPRYSVVPALLGLSGAAVLADRLRPVLRARTVAAAGSVALVILVLGWAANLREPNRRSDGPRWSDGVAAARASCTRGATGAVEIPISPDGWEVVLPCQELVVR